jgi:hypothetical protein
MIVAMNALLGAILSYRVHKNSTTAFVMGLLLIEPYIAGIQSITKNHGRKTKEYALQRLFEVLIEAAPQSVFQLYISFVGVAVFSEGGGIGVLYFSIAMSMIRFCTRTFVLAFAPVLTLCTCIRARSYPRTRVLFFSLAYSVSQWGCSCTSIGRWRSGAV